MRQIKIDALGVARNEAGWIIGTLEAGPGNMLEFTDKGGTWIVAYDWPAMRFELSVRYSVAQSNITREA